MVGPILKMALLAAGLALAPLGDAAAQGAAPAKPEGKPEMREGCPGLIASRSPLFQPASMRLAALNADQMRITYVGHATFLLESPQLVRIATDYNDYVRPLVTPDVVTVSIMETPKHNKAKGGVLFSERAAKK